MMRTTIDIPDELMAEAQRVAGTKTKRDTVVRGLDELIKASLPRQLLELRGSDIIDLTQEELESMEADD